MRLPGSHLLAPHIRRVAAQCCHRIPARRLFSERPFQADDLVLLRNKNDRYAPPILSRPLKPGRRIESHRGVVLHDDIIGRTVRDVVQAQTPRTTKGTVGAEYRLHQVTLDDYCRLSRRLVTPIYPADANLIVSLLDLHPATTPDEGRDLLEVLEAGTGHGSLTLHLSRALRSCHAKLHTIEISSKFSAHAQEVVKGFRGGIYAENVDFHVGDVSQWIEQEMASRENSTAAFLAHAFLDLPGADRHLATVANALKTDGTLIVFNPNITQIIECATKVKDEGIQLELETVVELGLNGSSGGREWDVRFVRPRAAQKQECEQAAQVPQMAVNQNPESDLEETSIENAPPDPRWSLVCRPKVGERITGGGFLGVWRKHRDMQRVS